MHIIVVTDIFGLSSQIKQFCANCRQVSDASCTVIDPYHGQTLDFINEAGAYHYYLSQGGHKHYLAVFERALFELALSDKKNTDHEIIIIAFSAGASTVWQAISHQNLKKPMNIKHFIGFYPSQIRNHLSLQTEYPSTLILPTYEPHFDVKETIKALSSQPLVQTVQSNYLHGFMNLHSVNFQPNLAKKIWHELQQITLSTNKTATRAMLSDLLV